MKKFLHIAVILGVFLAAAVTGAAVASAQVFTEADFADPGELLARVFVFGIGLAALSAFLVFTFGGLMYLTAGDNESRVTQAKAFMSNAVLGLIIALTSWLVLYTINPDLVLKLNINALLEQFRVTTVPGAPSPLEQFQQLEAENIGTITGPGKERVTQVDQCIKDGGQVYQIFGGQEICLTETARRKQIVLRPEDKRMCEGAGGQVFTIPLSGEYCTKPIR